jgi:hypothetical protein
MDQISSSFPNGCKGFLAALANSKVADFLFYGICGGTGKPACLPPCTPRCWGASTGWAASEEAD